MSKKPNYEGSSPSYNNQSNSLDKDESSKYDEKWIDSGYVLEVGTTGLADRLNVGVRERKELEN